MAPGLLLDDAEAVSAHGTYVQTEKRCNSQDTLAVAHLDVQSYSDEHALVVDIVRSLCISGGCVVRGMFSMDALKAMEEDIRPYLDKTIPARAEREDFVPSSTRIVTGLLCKSRTYALEVAGNATWRRVCDHFLTSRLQNCWHGSEARSSVSRPQLSTTAAFSVGPRTRAQGLHRDDDIYHAQHAATATHQLGRDTMLCLFVAGKPCTKHNGATRIVPGSHLWDYTVAPPLYSGAPEKFAHAEMQPGDAFLMLGGVYHGAGANTTSNEERLVYAAFATRGYLRQEENQYLANDLDKIRELPQDLQRFAGFGASKPYMGWVDLEEPVQFLSPGAAVEPVGFW